MSADHLNLRDEYLSFRLAEEEYAIDILRVREIRAYERPTRIANAPDYVEGVINLRGVIVPIVDLRRRFAMPPPPAGIARVAIILTLGERSLGIVVDAVSDVVALARETIRPTPPELESVIERGFVRGLAPSAGGLLVVVALETLLAARPAQAQAA